MATRNGQLKPKAPPKPGELGVAAGKDETLSSQAGLVFNIGSSVYGGRPSVLELEEMLIRDSQARALEAGLTLLMRSAEPDFEEAEDDKGEAQACRDLFLKPANEGGMSTPLQTVIAQMSGAFARRQAFFELVWTVKDNQTVIDKIAFRRASTCSVNTDEHGNITGFTQEGYRDGNHFKVEIPEDKAFIYIHGYSSLNPIEGESVFESAYQDHVHKKKLRLLEALTLQKYGFPPLHIKSDAADREMLVTNAQSLQGGGVMATGLSDEVATLQGGGASEGAFREAIQYCDAQMSTAVHMQWLLLGTNTNTGSFALSKDHTDFFEVAENARRRDLASDLTHGPISAYVRFNFGEDAAYPRLTFPPLTEEDKQRALDTWQALVMKNGAEPVNPAVIEALQEKSLQRLDIDPEKIEEAIKENPIPMPSPGTPPASNGVAPAKNNGGDALAKAGQVLAQKLGANLSEDEADPLDGEDIWYEDENGEVVELHLPGLHNQKSHGGWSTHSPFHKSHRKANLKNVTPGGKDGSASTPGGGKGEAGWKDNVQPKTDGQPAFTSVQDAETWANVKGKEWANGLSPKEQDAVKYYQSNGYRYLNSFLRGQEAEADEYDKKAIESLDVALSRSVLDQPVVSHRYFTAEGADQLLNNAEALKGAIIEDKAYQSTTLSPDLASTRSRVAQSEGDAAVVAEIRLPKGAKAAPLDGHFLSSMSQEQELLLPRNTKYRVVAPPNPADSVPKVVLEVVV